MNKKINYKKIFASIFLFLFLLNTLVFVPYNVKYTYAQEPNLDDFPQTDEGYEQYMQALLGNPDFEYGDQINTGPENTVPLANINSKIRAANMNLLYPAGPPNEVSFDNLTADFTSCVGGMMAVNFMEVPLQLINRIGSTIEQSLSGATEGGGFWSVGLASIASAWTSSKRSTNDRENVAEHSIQILDTPIFLSTEDLGFCAKNVLYSYLTGTVIAWVNEGFNDAAVWVEDLVATLNNVYAISYREAIGEVNLCVDIEAPVRMAVDLDFLKTQQVPPRTGCTISVQDKVEVDAILSGEGFSIDAFEKLYSNPSNNAMGGYLVTTSLANQKATANEQELLTELEWNNGWWPFKDEQGKVVTPGQVIQDKVADALKIETENAKLADDWNQIIFLISNQLLRKELGSVRSPMSLKKN